MDDPEPSELVNAEQPCFESVPEVLETGEVQPIEPRPTFRPSSFDAVSDEQVNSEWREYERKMDGSTSTGRSSVPLTLSQKILIAVIVVFLIMVAAALLVYFLWLHPSTAENQGSSKFGTIQIRDLTTNITTGGTAKLVAANFQPGDQLQLTYTASSVGFSGRAVWSLSVDGGKTYTIQIADPTFANTVIWVIPSDIFTQTAVFRVSDADNLTHYVDTSKTDITIDPPFALIAGPGLKKDGDAVIEGRSVYCTIETDLTLKGISSAVSAWSVETSKDGRYFNAATTQTIVSVTLDTTASTVRIRWRPLATAQDVYYRITTTQLIQNGYPYELSVTSPKYIDILDQPSCNGVAPTSNFTVCSVLLYETATGRTNNFDSGSVVTLEFAYLNTFSGVATWSYSVDGGAFIPWTTDSGPDTSVSGIVSYQATLPDIFTSDFVARVVSGTQTKDSPQYNLEASFVILGITAGQEIDIYPSPGVNISTVMQMSSVGSIPTSWQVGFSDSSDHFYPVVSATASQGRVTVVWALTWEELGFTTGGTHLLEPLLFKAIFPGGSSQQSVLVTFTSVAAPVLKHSVFQDAGSGYNLCVSNGLLTLSPTSLCSQQWYGLVQDQTAQSTYICTYQSTSPSASDTCWGPNNTVLPFQVFPVAKSDGPVAYVSESAGIAVFHFYSYSNGDYVFTDNFQSVDALRVDPSNVNVGVYAWDANPL